MTLSSFDGIALQHFQLFLPVLEHAADDINHQLFGHALHFFEIGVSHLRLHHPELGQVAARLRFFRAKGRPEAVHFAERHRVRFVVKLAGLRQIHFLVFEVIHFEQRRGAFARRRREDRRIHQREAVRIEVIANRL